MNNTSHTRGPKPHRTAGQWILRVLYLMYQCLVAAPIFVVLTFITAIITAVGSIFGNRDFWGYRPPQIWSRITCRLFLMRVIVTGRENIDPKQSYVFVANHQGAYDIWTIYGYLNHNFKWLMKKELEKVRRQGYAISIEEISKNNYSIAVPVRDANGKVACAITVVGPLSRVNKGKLEQFIRIMKDAAQDASERLGYDGE